jgi:hypothetical protein
MPYSKATKNANTKIAMPYLIKKGWTPMQAAAIIGNLTAESYMHPHTPDGDLGTAVGLAQWRNDRQEKFEEIIGKPIKSSSLRDQLKFVDWELRNTEKKAGKLLTAAKTIEQATAVIDKYYERSYGGALDRRIKFAKAALEMYKMSRLDAQLEDTMDASDPTAASQPGNENEPVPSSGFPEKKSWLDRVKDKLFNKCV